MPGRPESWPQFGRYVALAMHRADVSRRLKAARWLAGGIDEKGRVTSLTVEALAQLAPLPENGISQNRLEEIEQQKVDARPMELEKIARALGVPDAWFSAPTPIQPALSEDVVRRAAELLGPQLLAAAQALLREQEAERGDTDEQDPHQGAG